MFTTLKAFLGLTIGELLAQDATLADTLVAALQKRDVKLDPDEPIGAHPMVLQLIEESRLDEVINLADVSGGARTALEAYLSPEALDEAVLLALLSKGDLSTAEATSTGKMIERYFVCEDSVDLVTAFNEISGTASNASMAAYTPSDWHSALVAAGAKLPAGTTMAAVAEVISRRLELLYPGSALLGRIPMVDESEHKAALDALVVLEARNPRRFDGTFGDLDVKDAPSANLPALEAHWNALVKMVRRCPGLGLEQVFDNLGLSTGQRYTEMQARITALVVAISNASGPSGRFDVLSLDLSRSSHAWTRFTLSSFAEPVTATVRAYQRMRVIGKDVDVAAQLLAAGYSSALAIARRPVADLQALPGLAGTKGAQLWETARQLSTDAALFVVGLSDQVGGAFDPAPTRPPPSVGQSFATLDGYDSLFGSQSYCDCAHCASILGPAAYFVDLMDFVKRETSGQVPVGDRLALKVRRPDLWTFPLTCSATTDLVPTLAIVNEVLENAVATGAHYPGTYDDRLAVEALVYQSVVGLPGATASFAQPFAGGLAQTSAQLAAFGIDRPGLAAAVGATGAHGHRVGLGMSTAWESLITTPRTTLETLSAVYGLTFASTATAPVADVDATVLGPAMGLDRAGLRALVRAWFVRQGGATPQIDAARRSADSVQNDIEWVRGLTADALDRMHRLTRLARLVSLPLAQVDRLLRIQGDGALASVGFFADLRTLAVRFGAALTEDDAASLTGPLDDVGLARWNRGIRDPAAAWPNASTRFVHPGLVSSGVAVGSSSAVRLTAALGLSDSATLALIRYLAPHLTQEASAGFDPAATDEGARYFILSGPNLSLLDRHARLAHLLGLTAEELTLLLGLAGVTQVTDLAGARVVVDAFDAWRASGRSLEVLVAATGGAPRGDGPLLDAEAVAEAIRTSAATGLIIADSIFAATLGMSDADSAAVLTANAALFEWSAGKRRVAATVVLDRTTVSAPAGIDVVVDGVRRTLAGADVIDVLTPRTVRAQLVAGLASATGRDADEVNELVGLAGLAIGIGIAIARSIDDPAQGNQLEIAIAAVARVDVATRGWSAAALAVLAHAPAIFGAGAWPIIDPAHPATPRFTFAQATALGRAAARGTAPDRQEAFLAVALLFDPATATFAPAADGALARLLGTTPATIAGLRGTAVLPAGVVAALDRVSALVRIADRLGVDGGALKGVVSDVDSERASAGSAIEHAAELRAERDAAEATRLSDARATLREQQRDALVDYLLRALTPRQFKDRVSLASYLLIDVDAGGCATTSRVVAATNTVQEYVTRITLGLERNETPTGSPGHVAAALSDAGTRSWEWRRAYRVWEANRKVFLWPENYLEPSLRDDKTHLFSQLEDTLGQSDLDEGSILSAYATYLQGLDELASLKIAGAYHDVAVGAEGDVLHLIGVTAKDPATFYYRSVTDVASIVDLISRPTSPERATVWGNWQKLELTAPTRYVSPIVHQGRLYLFWSSINTRAKQSLAAGAMSFQGYRHTYDLFMATLQPDGALGAAQRIPLQRFGLVFDQGPGAFLESLHGGVPDFSHDGASHGTEPVDGYTLEGAAWQRVTPMTVSGQLAVGLRNHRLVAGLDLFDRALTLLSFSSFIVAPRPLIRAFTDSALDMITAGEIRCAAPRAWSRHPEVTASAISTTMATFDYERDSYNNPLKFPPYADWRLLARATSVPDAMALPGMLGASILTVGNDVIALYPWAGSDAGRYLACRLGTTAVQGLSRQLFEHGIDGVIATAQQLSLAEAPLPMTIEGEAIIDRSDAGTLNFRGSFGTYLRELFFHIPMVIATSLAGRGRHADARRWFQRVFDPTATDVVDTTGVPADDVAHRQLDRVWRFREFRGLTVDRARDILTDGAALAAYREDPFNPHAIARRRLTAYQRHAFARYIDNVLEWGDLLFAQFTRETVEEARLLYQLAAELLGPRPARLGDCDSSTPVPRDYAHIEPLLYQADPLSIAAETELVARRLGAPTVPVSTTVPTMASMERLAIARQRVPWIASTTVSKPVSFGRQWLRGRTGAWGPSRSVGAVDGPLGIGGRVGAPARSVTDDTLATSLLAQLGPIFCVPVNKALLARWDRVEDRLWKIHHCRDLDGALRDLALFSPELDSMTRLEVTALGLTPDDLVSDVAREVPPYRFAYLIERAKGFASSLAGFGGALLGALERRDNEALSRLRQEQGLALARLTRRQRELDIGMAKEGLTAIDQQIKAAEFRRDYHSDLITVGLDRDELKEQNARGLSLAFQRIADAYHTIASALRLIPEANAPWSVSFGGRELGGVADSAGNVWSTRASILAAEAGRSSSAASYRRRDQSWRFQLRGAKDDLASLASQRRASVLRVKAAEQSLVTYDDSLQQLEDVLAFERDRVTNLALHTRLAQGLKQLYRLAYGHALALARLAERAYLYERGDTTGGLSAGYWDASLGGLLAGERLLSDLQGLDRRFLETHHRELEIDQPVALSQLDPEALWTLRETGRCEFSVPEVAFDAIYPGHWKRRLRAVRLTIPCVTGPYVNVGATLTLLGSKVRATPQGDLIDVPLAHGTTIATSTAQADGGVFELSFRDERYLPFEGQGAISTWRLELPRTVRAFDYGSITDVVVSLAHSAKSDESRREVVESTAATTGSILHHYATQPTTRIVSLREELGASFMRLLRAAPNAPVAFELTDDMLGPVFRGRPTSIELPRLALRLAKNATAATVRFTLDGVATGSFTVDSGYLGGLPSAPVAWTSSHPWTGTHTLTLVQAGDLAGGAEAALDPAKIQDLLLVLPVRLA